MKVLKVKKKGYLWIVCGVALLMCIGVVVIARAFPLVLITPPGIWPSLAKWYWSRSHIPGIPSLSSPTPSAIGQSYTDVVLTPDNLPAMVELARFAPASEAVGPIAALRLTPDGQVLLAAYAQENLLRLWRVKDGALMATFDVGVVSVGTTAFDGQGRLLVSAAGRTPCTEETGDAVNTHAVRLWDTQTGELIWDLSNEYSPGRVVSGVALSEDGQWLATVHPSEHSESRLYICNTANRRCTFISLVGTLETHIDFTGRRWVDERRIWQTPDVVTFDRANEIVALADREGRISLYWWDATRNEFWSWPSVNVDWEKANDYTTPLALEFAYSRRWLAAVRGEHFELWSLDGKHIRRTLSVNIPTSQSSDIAFSLGSDLVAVGTSEGWQIWDVVHSAKLAKGGDSSVFALTFSPDGCLFVWGGEDGVIHIWGVPMQ